MFTKVYFGNKITHCFAANQPVVVIKMTLDDVRMNFHT